MSLTPPQSTWMWKPRSKIAHEDKSVSAAGSGILGNLRRLGASTWQRRFVAIRGSLLVYGRSPSHIDKEIEISRIGDVNSLSTAYMQEQRAPQEYVGFGWVLHADGKEVTWACEDEDSRSQWISFFQNVGNTKNTGVTRSVSKLAQKFSSNESEKRPSISEIRCQVTAMTANLIYIDLVRRKDGANLIQESRPWADVETFAQVARGVLPKLELPRPTATPESRRIFTAALVEASLASSALSQLPEFHRFIGFEAYLKAYEHSYRGVMSSPKQPPLAANAEAHVTKSVTLTSLKTDVEQCFRIIDEAGTGYVEAKDTKPFFDALMPTNVTVPSVISAMIEESHIANNDAYGSKAFIDMVDKISKAAKVPVPEWVRRFFRACCSQLYAAFTHPRSFDVAELAMLQFVVAEAGLRNINDEEKNNREVPGSTHFQLDLDTFLEHMSIILEVLSLEELLNALRKGTHSHKVADLINGKAVEPKSINAIRKLRRLIDDERSRSSQSNRCGNCDALEARLRSMRGKIQKSEEDNSELQQECESHLDRINDLEDALSDKTETIFELQGELARIRSELVRARAREETLATQVREGAEELRKAGDSQKLHYAADVDEGRAAANGSILFLSPMTFGSVHTVPVVDLPGALVYNLPPECARPLGFTMDLFPTGAAGSEYFSCRSVNGRRTVAFAINGGKLSFTGSLFSLSVPIGQWSRVQLLFSWSDSRYDFLINNTMAMSRIPFRDADADSVNVLDVYPRKNTVVCYSNLHFQVEG